jgi:hypothetical protein
VRDYSWYDDGVYGSTEPSHAADMAELLVGRKVVSVTEDTMTLDNDTVLEIAPAGDCCAWYDIRHLGTVDNIITDVKFESGGFDEPKRDGAREWYTLFVYADNEKINLLTVEGNEGSGYYGRGYKVRVKEVA